MLLLQFFRAVAIFVRYSKPVNGRFRFKTVDNCQPLLIILEYNDSFLLPTDDGRKRAFLSTHLSIILPIISFPQRQNGSPRQLGGINVKRQVVPLPGNDVVMSGTPRL